MLPGFKIGYCTRMTRPEDEIEALRTQVASLTARVYALERGKYPLLRRNRKPSLRNKRNRRLRLSAERCCNLLLHR